jgi:hypothetical protein
VADQVQIVDYFYLTVPDKPGEAARILAALKQEGVSLLAFSGFPAGARKSQLDFLPADSAAFKRIAKRLGLKLSERKSGFLLQGVDRTGLAADILSPKFLLIGVSSCFRGWGCGVSGPIL